MFITQICSMDTYMTRFTKDHMLRELQVILLFEADHILMGAGEKMAEAFIGFASGMDREYCHRNPTDVDLTRFPIAATFANGYDYAFQPSLLNSIGEHEVQDLLVFMLGTPKAGGVSSGGETHEFMTPNGLCQIVAETVYARWKLEWDSNTAHTFTTRELALLADMTEGAVRNAIADKSDGGLRAIQGTKNPILIEHADALQWLLGRRGFVASPKSPNADRFMKEHLQSLVSPEALGSFVERRLIEQFSSIEQASASLGWNSDKVEPWCRGTFVFHEEQAKTLALALDLDLPIFAGKALEVTIRRELLKA